MAAAHAASQRQGYAAALAIWGPLAQAGVARAQNNVGACFAEGLGVERNQQLALRWLTLAAARGDADAQAMLGAAYHLGAGVPRDPVAALAWLIRAQNGGSSLAAPFLQAAHLGLGPADAARASKLAELPLPEPVA
jgi:TPR repeat protein